MIAADIQKKLLDLHLSKAKRSNAELDKYIAWYLGEESKKANLNIELALAASEYQQVSSAEDFRIDTNYVYAFIDTMLAVICPSNPQIAMSSNREENVKISQSREGLINQTMRMDKLRMKSRRIAMFASLAGKGWSKTVWNYETKRIETSIVHPKCLFHDPTQPMEKARYVIEAVPMTEQEFEAKLNHPEEAKRWRLEERFKPTFDRIPSWMTDGARGYYDSATYEAFKWTVVYEFHDLTEGKVSFWLENAVEPLWAGGPMYRFMRNPYASLVFNENPMDESGISDAKLIARHQERLNEVDALELWHTFTTIPVAMVNTNMLDNPAEFKSALASASGPGDMVDARMKNDLPIDGVIKYTQTPGSLPAFDNMRDRMTGQIEFILGLPQYSRGQVGKSDLATEMALADTATRTRNGTRIDLMNQWVVEISKKYLALWREFFPKAGEVSVPGRSGTALPVTRADLGFIENSEDERLFNEDWWYNYEVVASSPAENNKAVQVQRLVQFLPMFLKDPTIDKKPILQHVADLLGLKHFLTFQPAPPAGMPGMPGMPEGGPPAPNGHQIPIDGSLPEGQDELHESMIPQGARALASQPKMEV